MAQTDDPIARFSSWHDEAKQTNLQEPDSMVVSSTDAAGRPSSRVVLLRAVDARGFAFFTNLESRKGRELLARPFAALNFHWMPLQRQVRVEGSVSRVADAEADAYFASRARESQISAWASHQSEKLASEDELIARVAELETLYADAAVPRPPHWSGLRINPERIEFWQEGAYRRHRRELYERATGATTWTVSLLSP